MKRVLKYGTGHEVPDDAVYLCTQVETVKLATVKSDDKSLDNVVHCELTHNSLVWHYYEVKS